MKKGIFLAAILLCMGHSLNSCHGNHAVKVHDIAHMEGDVVHIRQMVWHERRWQCSRDVYVGGVESWTLEVLPDASVEAVFQRKDGKGTKVYERVCHIEWHSRER